MEVISIKSIIMGEHSHRLHIPTIHLKNVTFLCDKITLKIHQKLKAFTIKHLPSETAILLFESPV